MDRPAVSRRRVVALALLAVALVVIVQPSPALVPGLSDHTGPTEMHVQSVERLDAGCEERVATYGQTSLEGGNLTKVSFVPTERADADLGVWTERTSPEGADLSTFRVNVETHSAGPANESCQTGILYELSVSTSGGQPAGLVPDAHGHRVLWLENGAFAGCSVSVTSPLETECNRFQAPVDRTWTNATDAE